MRSPAVGLAGKDLPADGEATAALQKPKRGPRTPAPALSRSSRKPSAASETMARVSMAKAVEGPEDSRVRPRLAVRSVEVTSRSRRA